MAKVDHRAPGGRLAGAPDDKEISATAAALPRVTEEVPTVTDALVGYMAARLYAAEQRHLRRSVPVTFEDQQKYLMDKAYLVMAGRDLEHYRDIAATQREQERQGDLA